MDISELKAGASNVTVVAKVKEKSEPREVVTKYGKRLSVADIVLEDSTGTIKMSLWGNDINAVNVGDTIEVSNGYVNEFRGTPQLSTGKFGKISVKEHGDSSVTESVESADYTEESPEDSAESEI
ncbi:MAG: OB-fold nucleic acid binding domain-containing protein [Candidatus Micrarchaeaceae archaeon]